jgi:hypothetical protein
MNGWNVHRGDSVLATNAYGEQVPMVAMSGPERGRDFPIIWVCLPADFARDGWTRTEHWRPWPVEDVTPDTGLADRLAADENAAKENDL